MIDTLYIEDDVVDHPVTLNIVERFSGAEIIHCGRYTQLFNRKAQNFRLQKKRPALILAKKHKNFVLKAPEQYNIGSQYNYYFSHMMNCIYDCRYCFLQGMYRSANYVLFVNYQDFFQAISKLAQQHDDQPVHFFSGYDCDSLALEPVSQFIEHCLPLFKSTTNGLLEIRTKSTQIRPLLNTDALANVVVAYSLSPEPIARALEHKAATLEKRLQAIINLQAAGWSIGLRFDPLIYCDNYQSLYQRLFDDVFQHIDLDKLHSVSLGNFRLPGGFFKTLSKLYPEEPLFASNLEDNAGMVSYPRNVRQEMLGFCQDALLQYMPSNLLFVCDDQVAP